jgi:hypothetical protein
VRVRSVATVPRIAIPSAADSCGDVLTIPEDIPGVGRRDTLYRDRQERHERQPGADPEQDERGTVDT